MTDTTTRDDRKGEATLGALVADASRDLSALVRDEIELAKTEIRDDVKNGVMGGAMFGAAAFLGVLALVLLLIAAAEGLVALGVPRSLAYLIVAVVLLIVAAVLVLVGKSSVSKVGPPERTIRTSKETAAFLKKLRSPDAQPPPT
jgi:Putative Actinobacterial Holin-X, holin superfamily III